MFTSNNQALRSTIIKNSTPNNKYLGKNLTKDTQSSIVKTYERLMREIKDLNEWRYAIFIP